HQLTFRRGEISSARFAPDGQTVLYSAAWEGKPMEVFTSRVETPEPRPFGLVGADVLAVSHSGELAVSVGRRATANGWIRTGTLAVVDRGGNRKVVSQPFGSVQGLAWSPSGGEVWFTAAAIANRDLYSLTLSGRETIRARLAGSLTLHDISAGGRALIGRETFRVGTLGFSPGADREHELTWLDWSLARDLSPDGRT